MLRAGADAIEALRESQQYTNGWPSARSGAAVLQSGRCRSTEETHDRSDGCFSYMFGGFGLAQQRTTTPRADQGFRGNLNDLWRVQFGMSGAELRWVDGVSLNRHSITNPKGDQVMGKWEFDSDVVPVAFGTPRSMHQIWTTLPNNGLIASDCGHLQTSSGPRKHRA